MPNPSNIKEYYQSYLKKKVAKFVKRSKLILQQPKTSENSNNIDIKLAIIEHRKN